MYKTKFRQRLCRNRKILPRILRTKPRREGPSRCGHFLPEHAIPTSFSPDFSGQKWTLRKSSGGQNGWTPELPKKPRSTRAAPTTRFENSTRPQSLGLESPRGNFEISMSGNSAANQNSAANHRYPRAYTEL